MPIAKPLQMTNRVAVRSSSLARLSYDRDRRFLRWSSATEPCISMPVFPSRPTTVCYRPAPRAPTSTTTFEAAFRMQPFESSRRSRSANFSAR